MYGVTHTLRYYYNIIIVLDEPHKSPQKKKNRLKWKKKKLNVNQITV